MLNKDDPFKKSCQKVAPSYVTTKRLTPEWWPNVHLERFWNSKWKRVPLVLSWTLAMFLMTFAFVRFKIKKCPSSRAQKRMPLMLSMDLTHSKQNTDTKEKHKGDRFIFGEAIQKIAS